MEKRKDYEDVKFSASIVRTAIKRITEIARGESDYTHFSTLRGSERWTFDSLDEALSSYIENDVESARIELAWTSEKISFECRYFSSGTEISVKSQTRADIDAVFAIFDESPSEDRLPSRNSESKQRPRKPVIFVGHGRNRQWEKLKAHLQDKHGLEIVAYESGARAGHTIRDILDNMINRSSFALLVLTGEDKTEDGTRARQNVIHECGLFQGRLGFDRAIMLVETGVELASNFDGIQQLRFKKGRIAEVYGDVLATIRREFGPV